MRIAIIGGGITGLASAWEMQKKWGNQAEIILYEKTDRLGGWIRTLFQDGFLFEKGPRSLRTAGNGEATLQLIRELKMEDQLLFPSKSASKRWLYFNNRLHLIPYNLSSFFTLPWFWPVIPAIIKEPFRKIIDEDQSIDQFFTHRFGNFVSKRLIDPLVTGIYAGNFRQLSIAACFPDLYEQKGSIVLGAFKKKKKRTKQPPIFTLKRGMESLIHTLVDQLDIEFRLNESATPENLDADFVISAAPISQLQSPTCSVAVVNLGYRDKVLALDGFGYLIPSSESESILGVVWDSSAFPEQNGHRQETRLTVMIGGSQRPDLMEKSHDELIEIAKESLSRHLKIDRAPESVHCQIMRRAIPQYPVGWLDQVSALQEKYCLIGSHYTGVAVNDCIRQASLIENY